MGSVSLAVRSCGMHVAAKTMQHAAGRRAARDPVWTQHLCDGNVIRAYINVASSVVRVSVCLGVLYSD